MQRYFIFSNNTSGIGGAQLYILRKAKWLKSRGFEVVIFTGKKDYILFEEFNHFNIIEIPELNYSPNIFTEKDLNNIIESIISKSNLKDNCEEVFIESHQTSPALWAELFAMEIKSTNIVYALAPFSVKRKIYNKFFTEKLYRDEFLGCNKSFIKSNFPNIKTNNNYINIPFDKSEIQVLDCGKITDDIYDLNILTISRIDKTYIKNSIIDLGKFSKHNNKIKIKYDIYTDKTSGDKYEELVNITKEYATKIFIVNLKGPVNPLNNCIFESQDLFIGMGTAILNASSMNLPSLVVDYRNNKYYGFFGQDYFEFGMCDYLAEKDLSYFIDYLIKDKVQKETIGDKAYKLFMDEFENETVNQKFIKHLGEHFTKNFKGIEISEGIFDLRDLLDFVLIRLFGVKKSLKIKNFIISLIV